MSLIDDFIEGSDDLRRVSRRVAGTRPGGKFSPGATTVALVRMDVQTAKTTLARAIAGDTSTGAVDIFATAEQVEAAYLEGDGTETPLGWTDLIIESADPKQGPPGDRVEWQGRVYEITSVEPHDETGPLLPSARKYGAQDRGAA